MRYLFRVGDMLKTHGIVGLLISATLGLSGCMSNSYQAFIKPGASVDRTNQDQVACSVEANKLFPAANFPQTTPYGNVGYYGGGWGWGVGIVHTTDVNSGMRNQHRAQCMQLKGYKPVSFPICTQQQLAGRSYAPLTRAPAQSDNICAIKIDGGGRALVDITKPL